MLNDEKNRQIDYVGTHTHNIIPQTFLSSSFYFKVMISNAMRSFSVTSNNKLSTVITRHYITIIKQQ